MRLLTVAIERFPIAGRFIIARGARTEAVVVTVAITEGDAVGPRRMRALCPLRRDRRRRGCGDRGAAARDRGRARPRRAPGSDAAGRRPERPRLRALGPRRQAERRPGPCERRHRPPAAGLDRLHHQPRRTRRNGRRRPQGERPADPQDQARRAGGRPRADRRRPRRRARRDPHRRCERGLDARTTSTGILRPAPRRALPLSSSRFRPRRTRRCAGVPGRCRSAPTRACTTATASAVSSGSTTPSTSSSTRPAA